MRLTYVWRDTPPVIADLCHRFVLVCPLGTGLCDSLRHSI